MRQKFPKYNLKIAQNVAIHFLLDLEITLSTLVDTNLSILNILYDILQC